jgi:dihydroneopterin aldolase/2-amino-4-hydroxy-6-hydroxymethyldihydropteridine diphosphokinase/dihydropteroate synthase/2-amino-4-hydroxy-6-hydroxymethyldihydropteridine diphosphokinase/dihydropteroate synthase
MEHPKLFRTCQQLLNQLIYRQQEQGLKDLTKKVLCIRGKTWIWGDKTFVMGILNITPDSFSDGGLYLHNPAERALELFKSGADVIDVGGMSTRPGSEPIPIEDELKRCIPSIKNIRSSNDDLIISIDTYRSRVAQEAISAGADLINDVSGGLFDSLMFETMAKAKVPVVIMHLRGSKIYYYDIIAPKTMSQLVEYKNDDVIGDIVESLHIRVQKAISTGVRRWNIILDPGIGKNC